MHFDFRILDDKLVAALGRFARRRSTLPELAQYLDTIDQSLAAIGPEHVAEADSEIAYAAALYHAHETFDWNSLFALRRRWTDREILEAAPDIAVLFLCHRAGRLREAALRALDRPLSSPFHVALIEWRMNDWATQVRAAAKPCAVRCYAKTDASQIVKAMIAMLPLRVHWARWKTPATGLPELVQRPDVAVELAREMIRSPAGRLTQVLKQAMRYPGMEPFLMEMASTAVQPALRASAFRILIEGKVSWVDGRKFEWVDKPMGVSKIAPQISSRELAPPNDRLALISRAARDPSAIVQRTALDAIIEYDSVSQLARELAEQLKNAKSASIRTRAEWILRKNARTPT